MDWELEREIIAAGYRQLSKRYHPDHGGKPIDMVRLNDARDRLKAICAHGPEVVMPRGMNVPRYRDQESGIPIDPAVEAARREVNDFVCHYRERIRRDPVGSTILDAIATFLGVRPRRNPKSQRRRNPRGR